MKKAKAERKSDCELIVSRITNGTSHLVFEAWAKPELFKEWWVPKSAWTLRVWNSSKSISLLTLSLD